MSSATKPVQIKPDWRNPIHLLAFGFGSGAASFAPGTWGTVAALLPYYFLQDLSLLPYLAVIVISFLAGIYICGQTSKDLKVHDHGGIVWDEFVGLWITLMAVPTGWHWVALGFVLFRIFDIAKPWPIRWADRQVSGGFGIMLDDVLAGIYAWIVLQLIILMF
ncbi:phosphatidylglycerophosphatase A [Motiliproteus sp. MSK22-1]|uniref:phosphatidylglycerophosphatase A family protein n=1 Tax=Motiliproteus sp. MSK22-1 TaxID=1897630 RepID=UPI000979EC70|nr:phosphatidylglycerophosphatase A [Motiliproteus sp. MSK22-1]OMH39369.1 phosphatidylglycerophosphatase [Motiliproteus sp. MSK22-1]